jgi:hypothetical protein
MTPVFQLRKIAIYLLVLPVALFVGYLLSQPDSKSTFFFIGMLMCLGALPWLMKWHHALLIFACNATINVFFLPGQPDLWMLAAFISLFFSVWKRTISRRSELVLVPSLSIPLLLLGVLVLVTAKARGGIGLQSLGSSSVGTRRYISLIAAIVVFYALSYQKITKKRALVWVSLFFASGTIAVMSDLIYLAGPNFYFLYNFFPANLAWFQASYDFMGGDTVLRLEGVASASVAFCCFMLARYGAREILDLTRPWRLAIFLLAVILGFFGGFRGRLILIVMFFVVQFCLEGLWRTRWLPILLGATILIGAVVLPFTAKLPGSFQRVLSFLPVEVDASVRRDAEGSIVWRTEMWQALWPEVPKYFWLGKGYSFSQSDLYLTQIAQARGIERGYATAMLTAEYHHGPLSVIVPFGIWGALIFLWFVAVGIWVLHRNYRWGDKELQKVNTFLLTYYLVRACYFFTLYGSLYSDMVVFTAVLGLSVAVNGGVRNKRNLVVAGEKGVVGRLEESY